jgi:hypothetical protein
VPIVLAGSALHFAFDWSGHWLPLALIAAVNESVWEPMKLAFWPAVTWAVLVAHGRAHGPSATGKGSKGIAETVAE